MPMTQLPSAPSTSSPSTFDTKADAWVAALSTFVTEANAMATSGAIPAGGNITNNQNAETKIQVINNSSGASAFASVRLDNGTTSGFIAIKGTGFSGSGVKQANRMIADCGTIGINATTFLIGGIGDVEKFRLAVNNFMIGTTITNPVGNNVNGFSYDTSSSNLFISRVAGSPIALNRTNDGELCQWYRAGTQIAAVSITASVVSYNTSSDPSEKENFSIAPDVGALIDATSVWQYDWKVSKARQTVGFKAPELASNFGAHIPGLTTLNIDGRWSYDPSKLVPLLFQEVKSLRARVAVLESA